MTDTHSEQPNDAFPVPKPITLDNQLSDTVPTGATILVLLCCCILGLRWPLQITQHITDHRSPITYHTSHITNYIISHITRHITHPKTSHITHHITHHTSHITDDRCRSLLFSLPPNISSVLFSHVASCKDMTYLYIYNDWLKAMWNTMCSKTVVQKSNLSGAEDVERSRTFH